MRSQQDGLFGDATQQGWELKAGFSPQIVLEPQITQITQMAQMAQILTDYFGFQINLRESVPSV